MTGGRPQYGESVTTQWRRRLPPEVITRGVDGHLLAFDTRNQPGWVPLAPSYAVEPWRSLRELSHDRTHESRADARRPDPDPSRGPPVGTHDRPRALTGPAVDHTVKRPMSPLDPERTGEGGRGVGPESPHRRRFDRAGRRPRRDLVRDPTGCRVQPGPAVIRPGPTGPSLPVVVDAEAVDHPDHLGNVPSGVGTRCETGGVARPQRGRSARLQQTADGRLDLSDRRSSVGRRRARAATRWRRPTGRSVSARPSSRWRSRSWSTTRSIGSPVGADRPGQVAEVEAEIAGPLAPLGHRWSTVTRRSLSGRSAWNAATVEPRPDPAVTRADGRTRPWRPPAWRRAGTVRGRRR